MKFSNYFSLYLLGISTCFVVAAVDAIVAGRPALENQFPYQVSVQFDGHRHVCGGGIIDDRFILTAGHCVVHSTHQLLNRRISVLAGTNNLHGAGSSAVRVPVAKVFFPMTFPGNYWNDIAVLQLADSLQLAKLQTNLKKLEFSRNPNPDELATFAGFGDQTFENGISDESHGELLYASVSIIRDNSCLRQYNQSRKPVHIEANFCAHMRPPPFFDVLRPYGVCTRDQGSPLVYGGSIVGILTRRTFDCNERHHPALYVRVSHFARRISNVLQHSRDPGMISLNV